MADEFKYLEDALEGAARMKAVDPSSGQIKALIRLAKIKKDEINFLLANLQKRIEQANKAVAREPALKPFVKHVFGDLAPVERTHFERLRILDRFIKKAEKADEE